MPERERNLNQDVYLPKVYKQVVNFAAKNDGVFSFSKYSQHLDSVYTQDKHGDSAPKLKKRELDWKRTTVKNMLADGTLTRITDDSFRLNPKINRIISERSPPKNEFRAGKNHLKLLNLHSDGIITETALKEAIASKGAVNADRERKFQKGMLKNLAENGYLEKWPNGDFCLTVKSFELLQKDFSLNVDHIKVLKSEKGGVVPDTEQKGNDERSAIKQEARMRTVKELQDSGLIEKQVDGMHLTSRAKALVKDADENTANQDNRIEKTAISRINLQDSIFECLSYKGRFTIADIELQQDAEKIKKRLMTLIRKGFILEDGKDAFKLTPEFKDRLRVEKSRTVFRPVKLDAEFQKLSRNDRFQQSDIDSHPKKDLLEKRLNVLIGRQLVRKEFDGYTITSEFGKALNNLMSKDTFAITQFDAAFVEIAKDGAFTKEQLQRHPRAASLTKRLETLKERGLIIEKDGLCQLTPEFTDRLETARARSIDRSISIDVFTKEQKDMLRDMCIFSQLTEWQIYCYIYGRKRALMNGDLRWLLNKKVIEFDPIMKVYTPTGFGTIFARQLANRERYYKSKAKSRPEEIAHDVRVYEAYRDMLRKLGAQDCEVIYIKTDRELRSEYGRVPLANQVLGDIPDLRIYFKDENGNQDFKNIEIDCGYSTATIENKLSHLLHNNEIHWYANSEATAQRAAKAGARLGFKVVRAGDEKDKPADSLHTAKTLYVSVVEDDLSVHKVAFREGRRFNAFGKQKQST